MNLRGYGLALVSALLASTCRGRLEPGSRMPSTLAPNLGGSRASIVWVFRDEDWNNCEVTAILDDLRAAQQVSKRDFHVFLNGDAHQRRLVESSLASRDRVNASVHKLPRTGFSIIGVTTLAGIYVIQDNIIVAAWYPRARWRHSSTSAVGKTAVISRIREPYRIPQNATSGASNAGAPELSPAGLNVRRR